MSKMRIFYVIRIDWAGIWQPDVMCFRKARQWFTAEPPMVRYLTDDEYREQAEAETTSALEELRRACCRPDFPSWLAVSRLQAPKK